MKKKVEMAVKKSYQTSLSNSDGKLIQRDIPTSHLLSPAVT